MGPPKKPRKAPLSMPKNAPAAAAKGPLGVEFRFWGEGPKKIGLRV